MSIYPRYERAAELDHLLHLQSMGRPGDYERYKNDMSFFVQQNTLRNVLKLLDKAMEDEGVDLRVRDRVVHRVVFCETPEDTSDRLEYFGGRRNEQMRVDLGRLDELPPEVMDLIRAPDYRRAEGRLT